MIFHSTLRKCRNVTFREATFNGLAPDGGLYMPDITRRLPEAFFKNLPDMNLQEIGFVLTEMVAGDDIAAHDIKHIVSSALDFDIPAVKLSNDIYALEMFHGPTCAFKDVGARFMASTLKYFINGERHINILVATTGDAGGAIAHSLKNEPDADVFVVYPRGKLSREQEMQFATLGGNIHAIETGGTFDDCQRIVKEAFCDKELAHISLASGNSINPARFLPQMIPYFYGYSQILRSHNRCDNGITIAVPSGNLGNLCAGLIAKRLGLPVARFIAVNNINNAFAEYLSTGNYCPRKSVRTIASAMDVGSPSNITRINDLYSDNLDALKTDVTGVTVTDSEITATIADTYSSTGYLLDPHGASALFGLKKQMKTGIPGMFLATAHPAKFSGTIESITHERVKVPSVLNRNNASRHKIVTHIPPTLAALKKVILQNQFNNH